jgi:hypothetical protein
MDERPLNLDSMLERRIIGGQQQWCDGAFPGPDATVVYSAEQRLAADAFQALLKASVRLQSYMLRNLYLARHELKSGKECAMPQAIEIRHVSWNPDRGVCAQDFETTIQPYVRAAHLRGLLNFSALWNQVT